MKIINGGITASKGFLVNGLYCGIKKTKFKKEKHKNDIAILYCKEDCKTAAVYTQNKVKGAPIIVTKSNLQKTNNISHAIIVNSKNANTCNADGVEKAEKMCELTAKELKIKKEEVIVASTGVIGLTLPIEPIENCMHTLATEISADKNEEFATAIMTTDTIKKEYAVEFEIDGKICHIGGCAKGSGMIHPNMATTLNFITTDINITNDMLQKALSEIVKITYNCLTIDGDTSTNDMVCFMANGLSKNKEISEENTDYEIFKSALYEVMMNLTKMLAKDGEGATKMIECTCNNAKDLDTAITVAKEVVGSTLFKCAIFGKDANWGRILCAVGYADAEFDIEKVDVDIKSKFGKVSVCKNGSGIPFSEEEAFKILESDEIYINIDLNDGKTNAKAWGCDLTYDYVKINGSYRT